MMDAPPTRLPDAIIGWAAVADQAARFVWDGHDLAPGLGLALSGGGFRAMLFHVCQSAPNIDP